VCSKPGSAACKFSSRFSGPDGVSIELLFGENLNRKARIEIEQRLVVLGGALNALILERQFRPTLLVPGILQKLAEEIFDALVHA